jgi:2-dehydro-3-deoxyglucarate aldolase/4-hydroxy-2-oxoheptanedioate aldolase
VFIAQIETYEGVMNAGEIASVEGVDLLFVGPSDLRLDLSVRPASQTLNFDEAVSRIASSSARYGCGAGILIRDISQIASFQARGYDTLAITSDLGIIRKGYLEILERIKTKKLS